MLTPDIGLAVALAAEHIFFIQQFERQRKCDAGVHMKLFSTQVAILLQLLAGKRVREARV